MFRVAIITVSDKGASGQREDKSGPLIAKIVEDYGYRVLEETIIPDEEDLIYREIVRMVDQVEADLVLTSGGTGFSQRDVTPEATIKACQKMANGIAEAIRSYSLTITARAMLSRGVSGIRNKSLIINLPGSPKAVEEALDYILDSVNHGLEVLTGRSHDCART